MEEEAPPAQQQQEEEEGGGGRQGEGEGEGVSSTTLFPAGITLGEVREAIRGVKAFVEFDRGTRRPPRVLPPPQLVARGDGGGGGADGADGGGGTVPEDHVVFSYVLVTTETFPNPALAPDLPYNDLLPLANLVSFFFSPLMMLY
jgi:hypothetical protein